MATFNGTVILLLSLGSVAILAAGREPTTRLHFYMHDKISNPNATAVRVAEGPQTSTGPGINFGDIYGEYKGSTLAILSRDAIFSPMRELPMVGGSGAFRLARGYVLMKTYSFNQTLGDAVLEWDVYVMH
ncbi:dirigent protein 21-like [Musa acuminata AAA Group]|uniref:dirigent protein 21-like n=1 Tax=Musa acuminata AAA Group TaxID=214697 RepID=UPI0031D7DECE